MKNNSKEDWKWFALEKLSEADTHVDYAFVTDISQHDSTYPSRSVIADQNARRVRITKATGDVMLLEPMPEDEVSQRFLRAVTRIQTLWVADAFPDKTQLACG